MRVKKSTKRQIDLQISAMRRHMRKYLRQGHHAKYIYARNWLKMHTQLLKA